MLPLRDKSGEHFYEFVSRFVFYTLLVPNTFAVDAIYL